MARLQNRVQVVVILSDLSSDSAAERVWASANMGLGLGVLVNNAGPRRDGDFLGLDGRPRAALVRFWHGVDDFGAPVSVTSVAAPKMPR